MSEERTTYMLTKFLFYLFVQLFGLGVANIFGSFFSAYPTTGEILQASKNSTFHIYISFVSRNSQLYFAYSDHYSIGDSCYFECVT